MLTAEQLRKELDVEHVLKVMTALGITEHQDNGEYLSFRTICHNEYEEDAGYNLMYYKDTKLFHCFSECGETFNIFTMVKKRLELLYPLEEYYFDYFYFYVLNHSEIEGDLLYNDEEKYVSLLDKYEKQAIDGIFDYKKECVMEAFLNYLPIEWRQDGITEESMDIYNIKYSSMRNSVIIPHYDVNSRLIGIRSRSLDDEVVNKYGKYLPLKVEQTMYNHPVGMNLYGLNVVKDEIKKTGLAIVAESEKSCLQAQEFLGKNNIVVAVCGSRINRWQVLLLIKHCNVKEIVLAFDREEKDGENRYYQKLFDMCKKYKGYCNMSFIYDNHQLKMKENVFDAGKNVFYDLIQRRIKV